MWHGARLGIFLIDLRLEHPGVSASTWASKVRIDGIVGPVLTACSEGAREANPYMGGCQNYGPFIGSLL